MSVVLVALTLFLLASSSLPVAAPYSIGFRLIGAFIVIAPVFWRRRLPVRASSAPLRGILIAGLGFSTYLAASTVLHGDLRGMLSGVAPFLLVSWLVFVLSTYYSAEQVVDGSYAAMLLVCGASLLLWRFDPATAVENGRLRGVIENANGLGFTAFALAAISLAGRRRAWQRRLGLGVAVASLFLSGSRASALALAIAVLGMAVAGLRPAQRLVTVGALGGAIAWLAFPRFFSGLVLFRTIDTRSIGVELVDQAMSDSFWIGWGEIPSSVMVAGSPFAAGITGGMIGLIGVGTMYMGLLANYARSRPRALVFAFAGIAHSVFESWMLSFSAPMLLTFFVVLVGFAGLDSSVQTMTAPELLRRHGKLSGKQSEP